MGRLSVAVAGWESRGSVLCTRVKLANRIPHPYIPPRVPPSAGRVPGLPHLLLFVVLTAPAPSSCRNANPSGHPRNMQMSSQCGMCKRKRPFDAVDFERPPKLKSADEKRKLCHTVCALCCMEGAFFNQGFGACPACKKPVDSYSIVGGDGKKRRVETGEAARSKASGECLLLLLLLPASLRTDAALAFLLIAPCWVSHLSAVCV